ncbi:hypothetical protein TNCV_623441 [Trichonephila clavipes]|nr:hypothetical protein TNCV_623441 [Trichonephila clavipes]
MPVFLTASDRGSLRSSTVFRITILNQSIPSSANSHKISMHTSSNPSTLQFDLYQSQKHAVFKELGIFKDISTGYFWNDVRTGLGLPQFTINTHSVEKRQSVDPVHEQMSRFGGLSEEKPSVFKTRSKFGTHLSTQCSGDERQSRPCAAR